MFPSSPFMYPRNKQSPSDAPAHCYCCYCCCCLCVFKPPNLYPLGTLCMINHVQRGRRWVNESRVIGFHVPRTMQSSRGSGELERRMACLKEDVEARWAEGSRYRPLAWFHFFYFLERFQTPPLKYTFVRSEPSQFLMSAIAIKGILYLFNRFCWGEGRDNWKLGSKKKILLNFWQQTNK